MNGKKARKLRGDVRSTLPEDAPLRLARAFYRLVKHYTTHHQQEARRG